MSKQLLCHRLVSRHVATVRTDAQSLARAIICITRRTTGSSGQTVPWHGGVIQAVMPAHVNRLKGVTPRNPHLHIISFSYIDPFHIICAF